MIAKGQHGVHGKPKFLVKGFSGTFTCALIVEFSSGITFWVMWVLARASIWLTFTGGNMSTLFGASLTGVVRTDSRELAVPQDRYYIGPDPWATQQCPMFLRVSPGNTWVADERDN